MEVVIDINVFLYVVVEEMFCYREVFEFLYFFFLEKWIVLIIVIYEVVWNFRKFGFLSEEVREFVE